MSRAVGLARAVRRASRRQVEETGLQILNLLRYVTRHPLNSKAKMAACGRVLRWQLASRLIGAPIALPFVNETRLLVTRGMTGATGNFYCGLHEISEMGFALHFLREGEHFLDVGANIGSYTVLASCAGAHVTSVEPIPVTFAKLEDNVLLNQLTQRVRLCNVGLSERPGVLRFSADLDTVNHVLPIGSSLPAVEVEVLPLDEPIGVDIPVLIKIDVEGHELSVLNGGRRTLGDSRLRAVIMETNQSGSRYGVSDDDLRCIMTSNGFVGFGYDPFSRLMADVAPDAANTIFVRDRDEVSDRVKSAPMFQLINGAI